MASVKVPEELQDDNRDVADLWKEALQKYKGIVGFDLQPKFSNVGEMIDFGTEQMNNFHKFRHDGKKVDKLRSIFKSNLDLLEQGAQQLISAATPAFPPAAAIGTAMTYVLQACRAQSADYDVVNVFFDDMNSFLQRIVILETRLPSHKAYQNCLMEVFNSFLSMCGIAYKYIQAGRFKKWLSNLLEGQDSELAGARGTMDKNLSRLQNATEFAILGNTEETKKMARELRQNSEAHTRMLQEQRQYLESIQETAENTHSDVQKILKMMTAQKTSQAPAGKTPSASRLRSAMVSVAADEHEYTVLKETMIPNTGTWVFTDPVWGSWVKLKERPPLAIAGPPGFGKSHLAFAVLGKLREMADEDPNTAVGHFYFRNQQKPFKYFLSGIVTAINQIAEANAKICEQLNAVFFRDETPINQFDWEDLVVHALTPVFGPDSKNHLLLLFDGLDELDDDAESSFVPFAQILAREKLNISVVATCRTLYLDNLKDVEHMVIEVTKEKQLTDLKALAWHRVKELSRLRTFSSYVQQRIVDKIVEASPNLLYAEHMLVRLNNLGREGAALQMLSKMPASLQDLYDMLVDECSRRMTPAHQYVAAMLLHWMAFARQDLTLGAVESLLRYLSKDDSFSLEELPELVNKFLLIGDPVDAEARKTLQTLQYEVSDVEKEQYDYLEDEKLVVRFQERSLLDFFCEQEDENKPFRWRASEAQRRMFLACVDMLKADFNPQLRDYAADELLSHWCNIDMESHTPAQQIEVMEGLAKAMSYTGGLADVLSGLPQLYYTEQEEATTYVDGLILEWVKLLDKEEIRSQLSQHAESWYTELREDPRRLRLGLAKGFLALLYRAPGKVAAMKQFQLVKNVLYVCSLQSLMTNNATKLYPAKVEDVDDSEESKVEDTGTLVLGTVNLFEEVPMDDCAYRAVSEIIADYHPDIAEQLCQTALEVNSDITERCKILILLAEIRLMDKPIEAQEAIESCLQYLSNETVPVDIKQKICITKAGVEARRGLPTTAYREARAVDPNTMVPGIALVEELGVYENTNDQSGYMATLKSFTPLERLTWMTYMYVEDNGQRQAYLRECAASDKDFLVSILLETIGYLENFNASAPLKVDLAVTYLEVMGDVDAARKTLEEVFETGSNGWVWAITHEDPQNTLYSALLLMTDTLFQQFYRSRDPKVKLEALHTLKGLTQRRFALDIPATTPGVMLHYRVTMAMMSLKLGQAMEFQSLLQSVIDTCLGALNDKVNWNDAHNLRELGHALGVLSQSIRDPGMSQELLRYARIVLSAILSRLGEQDEAMPGQESTDEGDLIAGILNPTLCEGECKPRREFTRWGYSTVYYCLTCCVDILCEPCYLARQAATGRFLCNKTHNHLKLPIEGWKGVKDGVLRLEGEHIPLNDFFDKLRGKVNEAWDEFWEGA